MTAEKEGAARDSGQGALRPMASTPRALLRAMPWLFVLIWSTGFIVAQGFPTAWAAESYIANNGHIGGYPDDPTFDY